ncbi:MAG: cyclic nucleotide-binding domain-containing protein, partial [Proteobacteria bacterium]
MKLEKADILDYCKDLKKQRFKSGQVILPEGERLGKLYVLIGGQVEIIRERTQVTHVDEPGSIFGEMAVLL